MSAKLTVLGSSSHGNGYIVHTDKESLILETGVPFKDILGTEDYSLLRMKGVIVSHRHTDHTKYIRQYQRYFIPIYSNKEVCNKYYGVKFLKDMKRYKIGGFSVMPLSVPHGDTECYSYVIDLPDNEGRVLFITDCERFNYRIHNVTVMMIEANYDENIIIDAACDGAEIRSRSENHMEINDAIQAIENNATGKLQKIVLLHLSDSFSDAEGFQRRVHKEFGIPTFVADKGMEIDISKYDF